MNNLPSEYSSWRDYISNIGNKIASIESSKNVLGITGLAIIASSIIGAIATGIIGNLIASTRLIEKMAKDSMLPSYLKKVDENNVPTNAILTVLAISIIIALLGLSAIDWIVDVANLSASIAYCYTSYIAFKIAKEENTYENIIDKELFLD